MNFWNFSTNFRISQRSSEYYSEKLSEIDCKTVHEDIGYFTSWNDKTESDVSTFEFLEKGLSLEMSNFVDDEMRWATLFNEGDIWHYFSYTDNLMVIITLKPNPPYQLSLWEETGVPGENPWLSVERWLYSFRMRTGFESTLRWTLLGIELGTVEVKASGLTTTPPKPHLSFKVVKELISLCTFAVLLALPTLATLVQDIKTVYDICSCSTSP